MLLNKIRGSQTKTQHWALRCYQKAFGVVISLSKQEMKDAPQQEQH